MPLTVAEIRDAALALSATERAELAELLEASLEAESLHPAWADELRRRAAGVDPGQVRPVPWDEVRRQVGAQLDDGEPANS